MPFQNTENLSQPVKDFKMKNHKFNIFTKRFLIIFSAILVLFFGIALRSYTNAHFQEISEIKYDFTQLGSQDNPTTDWKTLELALEAVGQRSLENKDGWLHFRSKGYNPPDEVDHPFYAKDGHYFTDMWYYVNAAGAVERIFGVRTDTEGNDLQVIACGEGICGNLSKLQLGDDYHSPAIEDFSPSIRPPTTEGLINEINVMKAPIVAGWIENEGESETLYIERSTFHDETYDDNDPVVGSKIIYGFDTKAGEFAYFSTYILNEDGSYELMLEDYLILFEVQNINPAVSDRYTQVISALTEGK